MKTRFLSGGLVLVLVTMIAAVDRVNQRAGNTQAAAILAKSRIDLKGDEAYFIYNASGDATHWRHNVRAYLDVGYWAAELMKPMLAEGADHATDRNVQENLAKYDRLFKEGDAAHKDPAYEAMMKKQTGRPPMKSAGGNNIQSQAPR